MAPATDEMSAIVLVFGCRHDVAIRALRRPATEKAPRHEVAGSWGPSGSER